MSDFIPSARGKEQGFMSRPKTPDGLLYGGMRVGGTFIVQRLSYVLMHAYTRSMDTVNGYDTLSESTISARLAGQRQLIDNFLSAWYDEDTITCMMGGKEGAEARYDMARKKPARALARLKDKGFYADTYDGLSKLIDREAGAHLVVSFSAWLAISAGFVWKHADFKLSDDVWLTAIELTMILAEPKVYFDFKNETQWIRYLEENSTLLWTLTYYIATIGFYSMYALEHNDMISRLHNYEQSLNAIETIAGETEVSLAKEIDGLRKQIVDRDDELRKKTKALFGLQHENGVLKERIAELEAQMNGPGEESFVEADAEPGAFEQVESELELLLDLPEANILFMGGHPNMLSKLTPLFPKWRFISTEISPAALPKDMRPAFIFVWSNHISHPLFDRMQMLYGDCPMGYCRMTNIELLVDEMRKLYTDHIMKQKSGD